MNASPPKIILTAHNLHWIDGSQDNPADLCAHGEVAFSISHSPIVQPQEGDWCVSAAALYLLRTLTQSHTAQTPVGEHIFPCCGHSMVASPEQEDCIIWGCPNGVNFTLQHQDRNILITLENGDTFTISKQAWRTAVLQFSDQIWEFYANASPKTPFDEEAQEGFEAFQKEWQRRREAERTA